MRNANKVKISVGVLLLIILGILGIIALVLLNRDPWSMLIVRLPRNLSPDEYTVVLQPHFYTRLTDDTNTTIRNQTNLLTGNSTVNFHCVEKTSKIVLHAHELKVSNPVVTNLHSNQTLDVYNIKQRPGQILEIQLNEDLEEGVKYSLSLDFSGELSDNLIGLFLSGYADEETEGMSDPDRYLVATNMEPMDARLAFPCFDEPQMKAVFHVTLIHRRNTTALGNAAVLESGDIDEDWTVTRFHPTPKMSTYLFAVAVSEFASLTSEHPRVKVQIHARPAAIKARRTEAAVNFTGRILRFYEEYLGIEYGLRKLDQIALPELQPAAMENWGLVTYKEVSLLEMESEVPSLMRIAVANIIAHELAHQWFGNLVTMKWWNEIWLNEGFASYMTYAAIRHVTQDSDTVNVLVRGALHNAFEADHSQTHTLSVPMEDVQTTNDVFNLFDSISYNKGAVVLHMLADAIEEHVFLKGTKIYLKDFAYSNADQYDLWRSVQKAVDESGGHLDVAEVMTTWTTQAGFPLLTINTTTGDVVQEHWGESDKDASWRWHVPLRVMTATSGSSVVWLRNQSKVQSDELKSRNGEWILANVNYTGYYKVNYDPENWRRLLAQLETDLHRIPSMNRMGLIENVFEFTQAKMVDVTLSLNVTRFLRDEREYLPWLVLGEVLQFWNDMLDRSEVYGLMKAYWRTRVKGIYDLFRNYTDTSTLPEGFNQQHFHRMAVLLACTSDLPECVEVASKTFARWIASNKTLTKNPFNIQETILLCRGMATAGQKEWDHVWDLVQSSEQNELYKLLSCTTNTTLLQRYLEYTLDREKIPLASASLVVSNIAKNVAGHQLAWDFIRAHWEHLRQEWSDWESTMVIEMVAKRFSTETELSEVEALVSRYDLNSGLTEITDNIRENIEWVQKNKEVFREWFQRESAS